MSIEVLLWALAGLSIVAIGLLGVLLGRIDGRSAPATLARLEAFEKTQARVELAVRDEIARNRAEAGAAARDGREELGRSLAALGDSLQSRAAEIASLQQEQLGQFGAQLAALLSTVERRLGGLTESNDSKLESLRITVDERLGQMQRDNTEKLERMRQTVDERLHGTLEERLGASFKQVSERLEQVHSGLGEMRTLAAGVGDLKKVLGNVKTRGGWGEVQLEAILQEFLSPEQFDRNVRTVDGGTEAVEFAIRLPGGPNGRREHVWIPIDSKFPLEDYQRLVDAAEAGDRDVLDLAGRALERRVRTCAREICAKYVNPPRTTDFAIMFLPTEGLYAEVARRTGLLETLQRDHRVTVTGPATFVAFLNSLQMGFRTLAIQERSSEVWKLLGAVKTEFGRFGETLDGVKKKLEQASKTMDETARRSRAIERQLRRVEELPSPDAALLLGEDTDTPETPDDPLEQLTAEAV